MKNLKRIVAMFAMLAVLLSSFAFAEGEVAVEAVESVAATVAAAELPAEEAYAEIPEEDRVEATRPLIPRRFQGVDGWELSEMTALSHQQVMQEIRARQKEDPAYVPATIATIPQVRMTRRIAGLTQMDTSDDHRDVPDSVGLISNWKKRGPVYAVPFSALRGAKVRNLLAAGRCIAATDPMWDVTRVIPACAVTGQAAGTAAAMAEDFDCIDLAALQRTLRRDGIPLTMAEIGG